MEALSLTGFKTRTTISLIVVIVILLMTFGIQHYQLKDQADNIVLADVLGNLRTQTQTAKLQITQFHKTDKIDEKERLKLELIESLSRLGESLNYIESMDEPSPHVKAIINGKNGIVVQAKSFVQHSRKMVSVTADPNRKVEFDDNAFVLLMQRQQKLYDLISQTLYSQNKKQQNTLQQLLALSVGLIVIGILFVVVPVLRRVKSDKNAIEQQHLLIQRIRHTFDTFTDHSQNGILNFEIETGRINFLNKSCAYMLKFDDPQEVVGKPISILTNSSVDKLLDEMTGKILTSKKEEIPVVFDSFTSKRIEDGTELVWLNITDLRPVMEMENRSQNAQKMESMGTLASGIAHDFNNILAIIRGSSELLKLSTELRDKPLKCLEHIIEAGERGAGMVRQILQFSRADTDFLKVVDIVAHIRQTIEILTPGLKKKCTVEFNTKASGNILADESSISQILINLVKNASQAGASIVKLDLVRKNDEFILDITDNGSGISQEVLTNIFEPFFSTKKRTEGTGLGLSVVHGIVEKLKGSISVSSQVNKGTSFEIRFPVSHLEIETDPESIEEKVGNRAQRILLVEDEDNLRNVYATYLKMKGFEVTEASNGEEAVAIFQQAVNDFDILLTDHNMPGLLGTEVILAIRHLSSKRLKTIMVTGDIEDAAKELKTQGLIDQLLVKPIALTALDSAINDLS